MSVVWRGIGLARVEFGVQLMPNLDRRTLALGEKVSKGVKSSEDLVGWPAQRVSAHEQEARRWRRLNPQAVGRRGTKAETGHTQSLAFIRKKVPSDSNHYWSSCIEFFCIWQLPALDNSNSTFMEIQTRFPYHIYKITPITDGILHGSLFSSFFTLAFPDSAKSPPP